MAVSPFGNLPLDTGTFLSRISQFMTSGVNYVATAFKPGYALQAAELNEIHEQHLFYQTLSNRSSYNWKAYDLNSIPYWEGCTPYNPSNITITNAGPRVTVTFNSPNWFYLMDTRLNAQSTNSGIGFWVNIVTPVTISFNPPQANNTTVRYGFTYEISTVGVNTDSTLKDQSNSLIAGITVPGADRIQIKNIQLVEFNTTLTKFSEIFAAKRTTNAYAIYWPYSNYSKQISGNIPVS